MSWLLLGLAVPIFVAFLTRRATRKDVVSSLAIFEVLTAEVEPRRRFAVPHHLLALLLTLAALIAATLALAGIGGDDRDVVVVLDRSASMGAADGRWEEALGALSDEADIGPGDRVALVSDGLVEPYGRDGRRLDERAGAWVPEGSDESAADLSIAKDLLPDEIVWITDGVGTTEVPEGVRVVRVGAPIDNLGIADVALRPVDGLGTLELQIVVANGTDEPRAIDVAVEVDGLLVEVVGLEVPARGEGSRVIRGAWQGKVLDVHLPGGDGLAADDHVQLTLEEPAPLDVVLRSDRPRSFLAEALSVHPRVSLHRCEPETACDDATLAFVEGDLELPEADRIVVFDGSGASLSEPRVLRWAFEDPIFHFVDLSRLGLSEATLVEGVPLIETEEGAIAAQDGRVLRFGFDLEKSDLPVRMAFLNMVANLVEMSAPTSPIEPAGLMDARESLLQPVELSEASPSPAGAHWTRRLLSAALLLLGLETALPYLRRLAERRQRQRLGTRAPDDEARLAG